MKIKTPIGTLDCQEMDVGPNTRKAGVQRLFYGVGKKGGEYSITLFSNQRLHVLRVGTYTLSKHNFELGQYSIEETIETAKEIA